MATPNEKEDAEVYPVVVLDPNGNDYTKGIAAWLTAIAKQNPKNLVCIARGIDPEKPEQSVYTLMRWETKGIELSEIAGYLTSVASELFSREQRNPIITIKRGKRSCNSIDKLPSPPAHPETISTGNLS